jgi:SAM-dependent methyltransferase
MSLPYDSCDVCGGADALLILESPRLDGPLVRCTTCGLVYIGRRTSDFTFAGVDETRSASLAAVVDDLGIVEPAVEEAERPWRIEADRQRLVLLERYARPGGKLVDVGCSLGTFVDAAGERFEACGVEPDPITSAQARRIGLNVTTGTLGDVTPPHDGFDVITMFHVIEHLDSPRRSLTAVRRAIARGGILLIETPTVDNWWFRLRRHTWRQLIPDHYYFFSRTTLERLLRDCGFEPIHYGTVGRRASLRFVADRLRRAGIPGAPLLSAMFERLAIGHKTVYANPGDIMAVVARAVHDPHAEQPGTPHQNPQRGSGGCPAAREPPEHGPCHPDPNP